MTTNTSTIEYIDPTTLLTDRNVREDLQMSKEFTASIKTHGVLSPIVAIQTDDGVRVRMGHRRTAAAIDAGLEVVPVLVVDSSAEGDAATIERLLTQHAENHHRAGLTNGENVSVYHQLSLLGVSATQIARKTSTKKADVEAGIKIGTSELATKATDRYDLTLDQALAVAEFEDDPETVKALIAAAEVGRFEHVAQRARNDRAEAQAQAPVIAALTEEGVTVTERPAYGTDAKALTSLVDADRNDLDPQAHTTCPGHAVYLTPTEIYTEPDGTVLDADRWGNVEWPDDKTPDDDEEAERRWEAVTVTTEWTPVPLCSDPKANGHRDRYESNYSTKTPAAEMSEDERAAAKAARKLVIENNKAWKAATQVRREWVKTYLTRKTIPACAGPLIAHALTTDADYVANTEANRIAAEWFGADAATYGRSVGLTAAAAEANDKRALVIALGVALAGYESQSGDGAWRRNGDHSPTGRYLRFLATIGYTLADVEDYASSAEQA